MEYINNYSYFLMDEVLEKVDYKWDFVNGVETDFRNNITYKIKKSFDKSGDKLKWYERLLNKITNMNNKSKVAIISIIIPLLLLSPMISAPDVIMKTNQIDSSLTSDIEMIMKSDTVNTESDKVLFPNLVNPLDLEISEKGIEFIKNEEQLRLRAYSLGDGMITIGYGHAERISKSKYKVGDFIAVKKADRLFRKDLSVAEKGIRRLFKQWEKEKVKVEINQNQYDALVSMAYNMGVGGLRSSDMILLVKQNKLKEAGEKIKETGISKKFKKGHSKRRNLESEVFLSLK